MKDPNYPTIKITCNCELSHDVRRTNEIPKDVISLGCNWCPACEDTAQEPYEEWYKRSDGGEDIPELPDNPNQLVMPFIIEETLKQLI